jgi:TetR/AcrR family transcriptional regulator, transcriptional repressor for nem operon
MQAALTNGAFYCYFASRNELLLEATKRAIEGTGNFFRKWTRKKPLRLKDILDAILDPEYIANPGEGCALCMLASDGMRL